MNNIKRREDSKEKKQMKGESPKTSKSVVSKDSKAHKKAITDSFK